MCLPWYSRLVREAKVLRQLSWPSRFYKQWVESRIFPSGYAIAWVGLRNGRNLSLLLAWVADSGGSFRNMMKEDIQ
jgi:hypothetical protein